MTMENIKDRWDLNDLYQGDVVLEIQKDLDYLDIKASTFSDRYFHNLQSCFMDTSLFRKAIEEYEEIQEMGMKPSLYATLCRAADNKDQKKENLSRQVLGKWQEISGTLLFFPLQIKSLSEEFLKEMAQNSILKPYRQFLLKLLREKPFDPSAPEEQAIRMKDVSEKASFLTLYVDTISSLSVSVFIELIIKLLAAGGSRDTVELLSSVGVNPAEEVIWEEAFHSIEKRIDAFEQLLT